MPHQKPDIRKQSYLGSSALHFTGKTGGVHIWVEPLGGEAQQDAKQPVLLKCWASLRSTQPTKSFLNP